MWFPVATLRMWLPYGLPLLPVCGTLCHRARLKLCLALHVCLRQPSSWLPHHRIDGLLWKRQQRQQKTMLNYSNTETVPTPREHKTKKKQTKQNSTHNKVKHTNKKKKPKTKRQVPPLCLFTPLSTDIAAWSWTDTSPDGRILCRGTFWAERTGLMRCNFHSWYLPDTPNERQAR